MVERGEEELVRGVQKGEEEALDGGARIHDPLTEHAVAHVEQHAQAYGHALVGEDRDLSARRRPPRSRTPPASSPGTRCPSASRTVAVTMTMSTPDSSRRGSRTICDSAPDTTRKAAMAVRAGMSSVCRGIISSYRSGRCLPCRNVTFRRHCQDRQRGCKSVTAHASETREFSPVFGCPANCIPKTHAATWRSIRPPFLYGGVRRQFTDDTFFTRDRRPRTSRARRSTPSPARRPAT